MRDHLPLGTLITGLDDISLGDPFRTGVEDIWTSYLTGTYHFTEEEKEGSGMGWCVDSAWWMGEFFFRFIYVRLFASFKTG